MIRVRLTVENITPPDAAELADLVDGIAGARAHLDTMPDEPAPAPRKKKKTFLTIAEARELLCDIQRRGFSAPAIRDAAQKYNVSTTTVKKIMTGTWKGRRA